MTIALSTSIPMPSAIPPNEMMLRVIPAKCTSAKVATTLRGMAVATTSVARKLRKKTSSTTAARIAPIPALSSTRHRHLDEVGGVPQHRQLGAVAIVAVEPRHLLTNARRHLDGVRPRLLVDLEAAFRGGRRGEADADVVAGEERNDACTIASAMTDPARIKPAQALEKVDDGSAILVCAYSDEEKCKRLRVDGALTLGEFRARLGELTQDLEVIFYCACLDEATSAWRAAQYRDQFISTRALEGGPAAWEEALRGRSSCSPRAAERL